MTKVISTETVHKQISALPPSPNPSSSFFEILKAAKKLAGIDCDRKPTLKEDSVIAFFFTLIQAGLISRENSTSNDQSSSNVYRNNAPESQKELSIDSCYFFDDDTVANGYTIRGYCINLVITLFRCFGLIKKPNIKTNHGFTWDDADVELIRTVAARVFLVFEVADIKDGESAENLLVSVRDRLNKVEFTLETPSIKVPYGLGNEFKMHFGFSPLFEEDTSEGPFKLAREAYLLWSEVNQDGHELILSPEGTSCFPRIQFTLHGVDVFKKFQIRLRFTTADKYKYDMLGKKKFIVSGDKSAMINHKNGLQYGNKWMESKIDFSYMTFTNGDESIPLGKIKLESLMKYKVCVGLVDEYDDTVQSQDIPICQFIARTNYTARSKSSELRRTFDKRSKAVKQRMQGNGERLRKITLVHFFSRNNSP